MRNRAQAKPSADHGGAADEGDLERKMVHLRELSHSLTAKQAATQKMSVLLGFSVVIASVFFFVTLFRVEMHADEQRRTVAGLSEKLSHLEDMQRLQSVSLSRIGSMLAAALESKPQA